MPNVGSSERVPSKTVHLRVAVEDLEGSPVAATETAVKLLSTSSFSARSREGDEVEVEVFLESEPQEQAASTAPDRYLLTMKLSETSDRGQQVSWRPSLALIEDTESLSTVTWGSAGRRIRVTVSEKELPIAVAAATPAQPSTEAKVELAATAAGTDAETAPGTTASPEVVGESEAP
jgi:hypothetical protein